MLSAKNKAYGRMVCRRPRLWLTPAVLIPLLGACSAASDWPDPSAWFEKDPAPERVAKTEAARSVSKEYPNLSSVPGAAPERTSAAERARIEESLVADRANAQYSGERLVAGAAATTPRQPVPKEPTAQMAPVEATGQPTSETRPIAPIPARAPEPPAIAADVPSEPPPRKPPPAKPDYQAAEPVPQPPLSPLSPLSPQSRAEPASSPRLAEEVPAQAAEPNAGIAEATGPEAEPEQPAPSQALTELQSRSAAPLETAAGPVPKGQGAEVPAQAPVPEPNAGISAATATEAEPKQPAPSQALTELQSRSAVPLETAAEPVPKAQGAEVPAQAPVPEPNVGIAAATATGSEAEPEQPAPSQALTELQSRSAAPLETAAGPAAGTQGTGTGGQVPEGLAEPAPPPPAPGLLEDAGGRPAAATEPATTVPSRQAEPNSTQSAAVPRPSPAAGERIQVVFAAGQIELTDDGRNQLLVVADSLLEDGSARIQLIAFAKAADGSTRSARRLSLSRAVAVRAFLVERGVKSTRIHVRALGDKTESGPPDRVDILPLSGGQ